MPRHHLEEHLEGQRVDVGRHRVGGHDLGDRHARVDARGEDSGAQVAVGEDAGEPLAVHDEQRRHPLARHDLRRLAHRHRRADHHRVTGQEVPHPGLEDGVAARGELERLDGTTHPARPLRVEEGVDVGVLRTQQPEVRRRQEEGQAVLDGRDVEGRRVALDDGGGAETGAGSSTADEAPRGVVDVGGSGAQHVEVVVVAPPGDELAAAPEVLDRHPRRQLVEDGIRQGVEGLVLREEVADLGQLDIDGHGPMVAVGRSAPVPPGGPSRPACAFVRRAGRSAGRKAPSGPGCCWNEGSRRRPAAPERKVWT